MTDRKPRARRGLRPTVVIIDEAQGPDPKAVALAIATEIAQKRADDGAR